MNFCVQIHLNAAENQLQRLRALQLAFARVCNALAPVVQQTRVWNRVALHHLAYHQLRAQFPELGSQMVCNAIYAVSRACRWVFQHADSSLAIATLQGKALPLLEFSDNGPVYFDRHTLSAKNGVLSLYTLGGRLRFQQALKAEDEELFHSHKLTEMILSGNEGDGYSLTLWLEVADEKAAEMPESTLPVAQSKDGHAKVVSHQPQGDRLVTGLVGDGEQAISSEQVARELVGRRHGAKRARSSGGVFAQVAPGALPEFIKVSGGQQ